jgi:excisionase family DNA binding protein
MTSTQEKRHKAMMERFGYISEEEFASLLGVTVRTLKNRPHSNLPEFVKAGRLRLFKEAAVRKYLEQKTLGAP